MSQRDRTLSHTQSNLASAEKRDRVVGQPQFHGHSEHLKDKAERKNEQAVRSSGGEIQKRRNCGASLQIGLRQISFNATGEIS
jgi:hypothetical protein